MAVTGINSEDRLVQKTIADHLEQKLDWESVYAWRQETFGVDGTLGRADPRAARREAAGGVRLQPRIRHSARDLSQHRQADWRTCLQSVEILKLQPCTACFC